jgi:hypothetical protein
MAIVSLTTIKNWFKTGLKPTQAQFWDVWDSFRHKSESVPYESIEGLDAVLLAQDVKINAIALPDDVIKEGEVIVTGTTVDILAEDFIWRLLQVQYTNAAAYNTVLPFATSGYIRTDIFVGTNLGTIYRVPGDEGVGVALKPSAPTGTIELASIDVESTVVGTPVIPKPRWAVSQQLRNGETGYAPSENVVFDALALKLDAADYNNHSKGVYLTEAALNAAHPTASAGDSAQVNIVGSTDVVNYSWDAEENIWVNNGSGGSGAVNTDTLPEGSTNLYFTVARFLTNLTLANIVAALGYTPSTAPNDAQKNSNITKAEIEAKLTGEITTHTHPAAAQNLDITILKIGTNTTLDNTYNGKVILLTASCTLTLPNGLALGFNYSVKTRAGVTLTYALGGSIVLLDNTGTTMAEKLSHTIANTGVANEYLCVGNL